MAFVKLEQQHFCADVENIFFFFFDIIIVVVINVVVMRGGRQRMVLPSIIFNK